ncbi:VanZ family protein [Flavobacterium rhizosphaerae]|uniref:VanZ family protein n=1 Tax=Flavobacterium rhizosphaerae TaxID=3163298 RepID=A0ABW8YVI7_9FLAO
MHKTYLGAALLWTVGIAVSCLVKMSTFENKVISLEHKDKFIHCTFYFGFTVLWYLALVKTDKQKMRLKVFIAAVLYGITIELCQGLFTADRSADVTDALANTIGSAIAITVIWLISKIKK